MQSVRASLGWVFVAKLIGQLFSWGITFLVIRLLSPGDYGLMALATIFVSFLSMFADMGLGVAVVQARETTTSHLRELFGATLLLNISLTALLWLGAPLTAIAFDEPRLTSLIQVLCFQFLISSFSSLALALLQRSLRFKAIALLEVSSGLCSGLTTLFFALTGHGVWSLVAGALAGQVWLAVWSNIVAGSWMYPSFRIVSSHQLLGVGGRVSLSRLLWYVTSQADVIVVGKILGSVALGTYSVAVQLSTMPMARVMAVINQVSLPAFARMQSEPNIAKQNLMDGASLIAFVAIPIFLAVSALAPDIVPLLLGPNWNEVVLPMQFIPLVVPLRMLGNFVNTAAQGLGRSDVVLHNSLVGAVVLPGAFLIGSRWGLEGICWAWILAVPVVFLHNLQYSLSFTGISLREFLHQLSIPAILSGIMCGAISGSRYAFSSLFPEWIMILVNSSVGAAVFLCGYAIFARSDFVRRLHLIRGRSAENTGGG